MVCKYLVITINRMEARQYKAKQLVGTGKITRGNGYYLVPSQSGNARHRVVLSGLFPSCSCSDFELTGAECKHILAARAFAAEKATGYPAETADPAERLPRPPRPRDWATYNRAQTTEKAWFLTLLLADLCRDIPQPDRKPTRGQRPVRLADAVYAAIFKVFSGYSARRFTTDLEDAASRGHIERPIHFNSVLNVFDNPAVTPILKDLIVASARPFRGVEREWAVDSSGFSSSKFVRWFDQKYGVTREETDWVKAHVLAGTTTCVIAAAEVLEHHSADSPQFPGLVATAATEHVVDQVTADKAYAASANFEAVDKVGGTLYAAFRNGTTGAVGGLFERAFHYFTLHRQEFLAKYHRRSVIESTFSGLKAKMGDSVRSKTDTAMRNEVYAKMVAWNLTRVVTAIYELGIAPEFGLTEEADATSTEPRDILRFPTCTSLNGPAHHKRGQ